MHDHGFLQRADRRRRRGWHPSVRRSPAASAGPGRSAAGPRRDAGRSWSTVARPGRWRRSSRSPARRPQRGARPARARGTSTSGGQCCSRLEPRRAAAGSVRTLDRRCSPGALYSKLTKAVLCSSGFRTSSVPGRAPVREVRGRARVRIGPPGSTAAPWRSTTSSRSRSGAPTTSRTSSPRRRSPRRGYPEKDKLENRLHAMVCANQMTLRAAQQQIAANWQALYKKVFGVPPLG